MPAQVCAEPLGRGAVVLVEAVALLRKDGVSVDGVFGSNEKVHIPTLPERDSAKGQHRKRRPLSTAAGMPAPFRVLVSTAASRAVATARKAIDRSRSRKPASTTGGSRDVCSASPWRASPAMRCLSTTARKFPQSCVRFRLSSRAFPSRGRRSALAISRNSGGAGGSFNVPPRSDRGPIMR